MLLWQSEKETATRLPQCEKGRTGFTAQKDKFNIYGRRGRSKPFFYLFDFFQQRDLAADGLAVSIEQIAKYINAWYLLDFR